ncbi:uncharacterized protein N0V89_010050 [Didymosphaeria variabile]|uniref:Uncharacterized protein n=1 Tax=Didymosphaeria variabile TaxID=1932322 RepID=A0A9W9C760_9PLEO|nr:uncharacterized protein N0V89_010050 [Didymosphaeria variabile]KAJ4348672.1 hypothetical protein N0V89_010050 [Didymosphaeria variabile]
MYRDKLAFELFIEKMWNAIGISITELVNDTWLEVLILDLVGQLAIVVVIASILALCVGRVDFIGNVFASTGLRNFAPSHGAPIQGSGGGANGGNTSDDIYQGDAADHDDDPHDGHNKEGAKLTNWHREVHLTSTPTKAPSIVPRAQPQQDSSMLVEHDVNTLDLLKYQTPLRQTGHATNEGDTDTIRKRKEQLDRLRMWS